MSDIMNEYADVCRERDSLKDQLEKERKKVGEFIREGQALAEFEEKQKRKIDRWRQMAERLAEALKYIVMEDQHCPCGEDPCHRIQMKAGLAISAYAALAGQTGKP